HFGVVPQRSCRVEEGPTKLRGAFGLARHGPVAEPVALWLQLPHDPRAEARLVVFGSGTCEGIARADNPLPNREVVLVAKPGQQPAVASRFELAGEDQRPRVVDEAVAIDG